MIAHSGLYKMQQPPLYVASKGKLSRLLTDDAQIDQLIVTAVRRCTAVLADLARLQTTPATLADLLAGPDRLRQLLVERVDFDAIDAIVSAADQLVAALGEDAQVKDPRVEFGGMIGMPAVREQVEDLKRAAEPYRKMREQLR